MTLNVYLYLYDFAGFLIQIVPCMILCLVAFPDAVYRRPRRQILAGVLIYGACVAAAVPVVFYSELFGLLDNQIALLANTYMAVFILTFIVIYCRVVRENLIKKLIVVFVVIFYAATVYMVVNALRSLFDVSDVYMGYSPFDVVWFAIISALLFPFIFYMNKTYLLEYLAENAVRHIMRVLRWVIPLTVVYIVLMAYYSAYNTMQPLVCASFILTAVILWIFYGMLLKESVRHKRDAASLQEAQIQNFRYEKATGDMETTRRLRHDMRHLLNGLYQIAEQGDVEAVRRSLREAISDVARVENRDFCDDRVLNSLLQYYVYLAEQEGIVCSVSAECQKSEISPADLTVLLGNLMENAIRACLETEGERKITIRIDRKRSNFLVQITNSCAAVRATGRYEMNGEYVPAGAFASMRRDGGHGLRSIELIAGKYGGEAGFRYDAPARQFTARIFMRSGAD